MGEQVITTPLENTAKKAGAGLSLLFGKGRRPDALEILAHASRSHGESPGFSVSYCPERTDGWVELLASGLTFDLSGLEPVAAAPLPSRAHAFGFDTAPVSEELQAIVLQPGPHLSGGEALLPVVRIMAGLGQSLARLPGVQAVCWHPARSWMEPAYYQRAIGAWLAGGAFPALGLTGFSRTDAGSLVSEGLGHLVGQEIEVGALPNENPAEVAKRAVRIAHDLVANGPIHESRDIGGPHGTRLRAEPSPDGRVLVVGAPR